MRKILILLFLTGLIFASVGKIATMSGDVSIIRDGSLVSATKGSVVENKDTITTTKGSRVQLIFNDKTIITIGSNSKFSISDYLYDEKNNQANASFSLSKGIFRAMTGKIGKIAPSKFKLKMKTATIGIRGTRFIGNIDDQKETIACTGGAISVSNSAGEVLVRAGEITSITNGAIPNTPREITKNDMKQFNAKLDIDPALAAKIESIKLDENLNFNKEEVAKIIAEILKIQNADVRMAVLHALEDSLYKQLEEQLQDYTKKVKFTKLPYEGGKLSWGFYTNEEPQKSESDSIDDIKKLGFDDVWIRYDDKIATDYITDPSIISGYIENHKKATYLGKSIGFINEKYAIKYDENNKVNITFDFYHQAVYGEISFDDENDGKWKILIGSAGDVVITSSGYEGINYADPQDSTHKKIISTQTMMFNNRFYGEKAKEISSYFRFLSKDGDEAYGLFIAGQESIKTMKEFPVNEDDSNFDWGYWAEDGTSDTSDANKLFGAYAKPVSSLELSDISSLITQKATASYQTDLIGTVSNSSGNTLITNGSATFNIDFGNQDVTGNMSFDAGSDKWSIDFTRGDVAKDTSSFSVSAISNKSDATVDVTHFNIGGKFYGNEAGYTAGTFMLNGSNGDIAAGAFKGAKQ